MSQILLPMPTYNSIRVNPTAKGRLSGMAKRRGKSETDFANNMIDYIYETGVDVYSKTIPSVPDLVKNLDNRIVSFLKKREQDFFVPMNKSFREMIRLHQQTFQMLDVLQPGTIGLDSNTKQEMVKPEKSTFTVPVSVSENTVNVATKNGLEKQKENSLENQSIPEEEKSELLGQMERLKVERSTYEKELKFLLENIRPNRSISGPKFTCDLPQKEIDRIKLLIDGN